jgi:hypothetical protein
VLAAPAAAQGVLATRGRVGANVAGLFALIGLITGWVALARSGRREGAPGKVGVGAAVGRDGAIVGLVLALSGIVLAALHLATTSGGFGTGQGRAGAIVALVLGLIGVVLGRRALGRARRPG